MVNQLVVLCLTALWCLSGSVHSCSTNAHFDYILLATQWPESFCEKSKCVPHQDRWAIHGAWPENNDGSWPQDCCTEAPFNATVLTPLEPELIAAWSTLKRGGTNDQFWSHEYTRHGTCAVAGANSTLMRDELSYFNSTLGAFHHLQLDQWLATGHIVPSETHQYAVTAIHEAIKTGLGHRVQLQCIKAAHHKFPVISQINVCLDKKTLVPFDCPSNDRGCQHATIGYLPSK